MPKSVIAANMTTEVRYGSLHSGGASVLSLFHCQGNSRTNMMVGKFNRQTPTGKFLNLCIEDLVLEAGLYGPLWGVPIKRY